MLSQHLLPHLPSCPLPRSSPLSDLSCRALRPRRQRTRSSWQALCVELVTDVSTQVEASVFLEPVDPVGACARGVYVVCLG